ncbi:transmembrane protein, putative [Medicago truncatula]|uniref:Transmembrane protein, putative n=1 Tax=Medicago truncatula TaxID=3880 RepID=G7LE00_MEDTR|nr:transmembrane protein, putative [Medicago truncatula]
MWQRGLHISTNCLSLLFSFIPLFSDGPPPSPPPPPPSSLSIPFLTTTIFTITGSAQICLNRRRPDLRFSHTSFFTPPPPSTHHHRVTIALNSYLAISSLSSFTLTGTPTILYINHPVSGGDQFTMSIGVGMPSI